PGPGPSALMRQPGRWSGGPRRWQGQVQGLVEVERPAGGVSLLKSLLAEPGTDPVEAVPAGAHFGLLPGFSGSLDQGLRGAVKLGCPIPVGHIPGDTRQAEAGIGEGCAFPAVAAHPQAGFEDVPRTVRVVFLA